LLSSLLAVEIATAEEVDSDVDGERWVGRGRKLIPKPPIPAFDAAPEPNGAALA